jgi:hypothetical protein
MAETVAPVETIVDSHKVSHVSGKIVTATDAAANNVEIGFIPSFIIIINYTNPSVHMYAHGMTAAYLLTIPATTGTLAIATSGGVTEYTGDGTHAPGFTYGTDATLNTAGDTLYFIAFR